MKKSIFVFLALAIFSGGFFIALTRHCEKSYWNDEAISYCSGLPRSFSSLAMTRTAHAEENTNDTGIVKGIFTEKIEDIDYQKEIYYGKSGLLSLDEMTKDLSIEIYSEDKVKIFPDPVLGIGSKIEILRANPVNVIDARDIKTYRTWTKTVGELLATEKIDIGEQDVVKPETDTAISRDLEIKITRVGYTEMKETETVDYKTINQDDSSLERGLTKTKQNGENGIKEFTYKIRRENGEEVSRKLISTEITKEAQDKIILKGTKVVSYGTGNATWYDWIGGMTAASNELPYGTKVKVINVANGKEVVVEIVDHGIKGGAIIDLSDQAFAQLAPLSKGKIQVRLEKP